MDEINCWKNTCWLRKTRFNDERGGEAAIAIRFVDVSSSAVKKHNEKIKLNVEDISGKRNIYK